MRITTLIARSGVWAALSTVAAFAGLLVAVLAPRLSAVALGLACAGLAVFVARHWRGIVRPRTGTSSIGAYLVTRFLVLVTCLVVGVALEGPSVGAALATSAIAAVFVLEFLVRNLRARPRPYAGNVPGYRARNEPSFIYGALVPLSLVALVCAMVAGLGPDLLYWVALCFAVAALAYALAVLADIVRRVVALLRFPNDVGAVLDSIAPVFYLHWHAPAGTAYQIAMWLPYLERLGVPFAVVVRTSGNFRDAMALTDRPVIMRESLESLDALIRPSLRGVFYVNTATRNDHFVRYAGLTHVQLNHGDSDKVPSFNPVFRMYDYDFVAGQAAIDRFAANGVPMPQEMFRIVGRPQVENVAVSTIPVHDITMKTVLYAPTWSGFFDDSNYSSLSVAPELIAALLARGCRVVFRPHPYTNRNPRLAAKRDEVVRMLEEDAAATGRAHVYGPVAESEMTVVDCINESDAMVSDVSSVVGDYLYSEKPLAMVSMRHTSEDFVAAFPMARAAYVLDASTGSFLDIEGGLDDLLDGDPQRSLRVQLKKYYLGDIPAHEYARRFIDVSRSVLRLDGDAGDDYSR